MNAREVVTAPGSSLRRGAAAYRRTLIALVLGGLANFALIYFVQPLLPDLAAQFGVSVAASGLALSSTTLAMLVGLLVAAPLSDRLGRVPIIGGSLVAAGALAVVCAFAPNWEMFLACRAGMGFALAIMPAAAMAYLREVIADDSYLAANAAYIAGTAMGGAVGRLAPLPLADLLWGWQTPTLVLAALALLAGAAVVLLLPRDRRASARESLAEGVTGTVRVVRDRGVLVLCLLGFVTMALFVAMYNAVPFRLDQIPGVDDAAHALVYFAYPIGIAAPTVFRHLVAHLGRAWTTAIGALGASLSLGLLVPATMWAVFFGLGLLTFVFLGTHSVLSAWVTTRAYLAGVSAARASSAYLLFYYGGSTVAGTAATVVWAIAGWPGVMGLGGALVAAWVGLIAIAPRLARMPHPPGRSASPLHPAE